jgi:hypothetical protein
MIIFVHDPAMCAEGFKECKKRSTGETKDDQEATLTDHEGRDTGGDTKGELADLLPLQPDFIPSPFDVIVGTGREAKNHNGNIGFRELLKGYIGRYSNAPFKLDKTMIISEIIAAVKEKSPSHTGFIKKHGRRWCAVDDHMAREKVSQGLRNILSGQYRSSARAKKRRRGQLCAEIDNGIGQLLQSKQSFLACRIDKLSAELKVKGNDAPEEAVFTMFTQANIDILEGLKKDTSIQASIEAITSSLSSEKEESEEIDFDGKASPQKSQP